jgi:regulatory protein
VNRVITALEIQKRNKDRVNVYLDGEFAFGLPIDEAMRLKMGQTLSNQDIVTLRQIDDIARAFDRAVRLLARRPYSTDEIRRKLVSHDTAPPVIDQVLAKLEHLGYVNDLEFARYWIENREQFQPRGPQAIRYELRQKGIATEIIESVLNDLDAHASAYRAAQSRIHRMRHLSRYEFRQKLGAFLARRGFQYDTANEVIGQLIAELEEDPDYFANDEE